MATLHVTDEYLSELKEQVFRKYGKLRGVLKAEADAAIRARAQELAREAGGAP